MQPKTFHLKKFNTLNSTNFEYQIDLIKLYPILRISFYNKKQRDNKTFVFFYFYFTPVFFVFIFTLIFPTPRYPLFSKFFILRLNPTFFFTNSYFYTPSFLFTCQTQHMQSMRQQSFFKKKGPRQTPQKKKETPSLVKK